MSDLIPAVKYRSCQGLACPKCAKKHKWVHLTALVECRPDHHSQDGYSYAEKPVYVVSAERLYDDDEPILPKVRDDFPSASSTLTAYRHRMTLVCNDCYTLYHRSRGVPHVFEDSELPLDYWADNAENLALMRKRGVSQETLEAHMKVLSALGIQPPEEVAGELKC